MKKKLAAGEEIGNRLATGEEEIVNGSRRNWRRVKTKLATRKEEEEEEAEEEEEEEEEDEGIRRKKKGTRRGSRRGRKRSFSFLYLQTPDQPPQRPLMLICIIPSFD